MQQGYARLRWLCYLVPFFFVTPVRAADWLPVSPEELQMKSEPKAPTASAIFLYRQLDRDDIAADESIYARINVLRYTRTAEIKELSVPAAQAAALKQFFRVIENDERVSAVLKRSP